MLGSNVWGYYMSHVTMHGNCPTCPCPHLVQYVWFSCLLSMSIRAVHSWELPVCPCPAHCWSHRLPVCGNRGRLWASCNGKNRATVQSVRVTNVRGEDRNRPSGLSSLGNHAWPGAVHARDTAQPCPLTPVGKVTGIVGLEPSATAAYQPARLTKWVGVVCIVRCCPLNQYPCVCGSLVSPNHCPHGVDKVCPGLAMSTVAAQGC